jgi:hypothetical protein
VRTTGYPNLTATPRALSRRLVRCHHGRMAVACRAVILPLTIRFHDTRLETTARRTVGFRVSCACGYKSRPVPSVAEARWVRREHLESHAQETWDGNSP